MYGALIAGDFKMPPKAKITRKRRAKGEDDEFNEELERLFHTFKVEKEIDDTDGSVQNFEDEDPDMLISDLPDLAKAVKMSWAPAVLSVISPMQMESQRISLANVRKLF